MNAKRNTPKSRRGVIGVESAIVLIAFVIVAAALSFVVLNMGFSTTQKAKTTISSGLETSGSALEVSGAVTAHTDSTKSYVDVVSIPIQVASGSSSVDLQTANTAIKYLSKSVSYDNIYNGTLSTTSYASLSDALAAAKTAGIIDGNPLAGTPANPTSTVAFVYWTTNADNNNVLDHQESAVLAVVYKAGDRPQQNDHATTEVLPTKGSPLTVERGIPTLTDRFMNLS